MVRTARPGVVTAASVLWTVLGVVLLVDAVGLVGGGRYPGEVSPVAALMVMMLVVIFGVLG